MSWLQSLVRPNIARLNAYSSARSLATHGKVFLDANEAPDSASSKFNRYPKPQPDELLHKFSVLYKVSPGNILMGRGSDEAIDILTRAFCEPNKDKIITTPPTYGMYKVSADIQNAEVITVPLKLENENWRLDVDAMIEKILSDSIKLVYICSPNNPTGTIFGKEEIQRVCVAASGKSLVVVDEAYIEFAIDQTSVPLLKEFPNLVVLRTLSKAWAMAGLRCGVLIADGEIIKLLQKVRAPYPLPKPVVEESLRLLSEQGREEMEQRVHRLITERERMARALRQSPLVDKVYPSYANFLLVRFKVEAEAMAYAAQLGIVLRSRHSEPGLENGIRITIGSEEENNLLIKAFSNGRSL